MSDFSLSASWVIWFWIIVILPTQIHEFYVIENKQTKDYLRIGIYCLFALAAGLLTLFSKTDHPVSSIAFYILIAILYLQSLYDCFKQRTKWSYISCCLFTVFLIALLVL